MLVHSNDAAHDTAIIRLGVEAAKRISSEFEAAIDRGEITMACLFDERYREIPGTDPKQYLTDYVQFTDRVLPPIQDPLRKADPPIIAMRISARMRGPMGS